MSLQELLDEPARLETKADSLEREIQTKAIEQNEVFEKALFGSGWKGRDAGSESELGGKNAEIRGIDA